MSEVLDWFPATIAALAGVATVVETARRRERASRRLPVVVRSVPRRRGRR